MVRLRIAKIVHHLIYHISHKNTDRSMWRGREEICGVGMKTWTRDWNSTRWMKGITM